jgi:hypothetical protein
MLACFASTSKLAARARDDSCGTDPVTIEGRWIKYEGHTRPKGKYSARLRLHLRSDGSVSSITFDQRTGFAPADDVIIREFSKWKMGPQWRNCTVAIIPVTVVLR